MSPVRNVEALLNEINVPAVRKRLGRGWSYVYWRNTAEFCSISRNVLCEVLVDMSTSAFGADMTTYWADRSRNGYFEQIAKFCLLVNPDGAVAGWTGYHKKTFAEARCLYLDSSGVVPALQGGGLLSRLQARLIVQEFARSFPRRLHLLARTESPVVYRLLRDGCGADNIWPAPGSVVPPQVARIAAGSAEWLGQQDRFDAMTLAVRGAYDNLEALYGSLPTCGESSIDAFFQETLEPDDAYVVVARASLRNVLRKWMDRERRTIGRVASHMRPGA